VAKRVVLHIGTMKSGTSFLQSALAWNRPILADGGARYLGGSFGRQTKAITEIQRSPLRTERHVRWRALADEAREFPGDVGIVSMEFLSFVEAGRLAPFLDPLEGLEVEVVLTVRDQFRAIPAQWQTFTRNLGTDDWETYLRKIGDSGWRNRRSHAATTFHRAQDVVSILERWSKPPSVRRVTVVTLPPPGAPQDVLWERFCTAARIPTLDVSVHGLRDNVSLGYASCDFLRRLNVHLADVRPRAYRKAMRPLGRDALAPLRDAEGRPELDREGSELAAERNQAIRDAVAREGYRLVGSLDDLPVPAHPAEAEPISLPPEDQVARAALAVQSYAAAAAEPDSDPGSESDQRAGAAPVTAAGKSLDVLVEEAALLLSRAHHWGL
jgi:hypothetical protein